MSENLALGRIKKMGAYTPPLDGRSDFDGLLLDFNERTSSAPSAVEALRNFAEAQQVHCYPEYFDLESKIADYCGVDPGQTMLTNGADQGIDIVFRTFSDAGDAVVLPAPGFAMYQQSAEVVGNTVFEAVFSEDAFPEAAFADVIQNHQPAIVTICNPNAPTGTLAGTDQIERIVAAAPDSLVMIDETYFEFSRTTSVELVAKFPNVVIVRSFSKPYGLASLRVGYLVASEAHITEMKKVRGPYDVNQAAQYAASAALANMGEIDSYTKEVMTVAKPHVEQFFTSNNIKFFSSAANFILFQPENPDRVLAILEANGIRIRNQNKPHIEGSLRVSIGTAAEMELFTNVYQTKILDHT